MDYRQQQFYAPYPQQQYYTPNNGAAVDMLNQYKYGQQQPMPMQQPMQQMPQPMQVQANGGLIWVDGEEQAKNYLVAPNNVVPMFDKLAPILYVKSADGAGMLTFKKYKLNDFEDAQEGNNNAQGHVCSCAGKYPSIAEFNALREKMEALSKEFEEYKKGGNE